MGFELFTFDWSGVISDDRRPVYEANMRGLREYGKPVMTFDEWLPRTAMSGAEFFAQHGICGKTDELNALYKKHLDRVISEGKLRPKVYDDAHEAFEFLKANGKRIAVLSSHPEENLSQEAKDYGLDGYIELSLGSSNDKSAGLKRIMRETGKKAGKVIYCDDMVYGITAAKSVGVASAAIAGPDGKQRGYHSREKLASSSPDFLLESLLDLKESKFI